MQKDGVLKENVDLDTKGRDLGVDHNQTDHVVDIKINPLITWSVKF